MEGLFLYIIDIIIHTIKDAVAIANCGTCQISGGWRLNRKVPHYIFTVEIIHHWIQERKTCFIYWCTFMHVCCWKPRCSVIISIRIHLGCGLWCTVVFICEIDLDLTLFLFDLLYVKLFCLLMHTIQDKVGIANCGTLCISSIPFVSFFPGVLCRCFHHFCKYVISYKSWCYVSFFIFFSMQYLSFCLRLWNLPCEIIDLVLFLFDLLCWIYFGYLRLWNLACEILGLVLFVFDLLCSQSFCCL